MSNLLATLRYTPHELKFGTSGRRGLVREMPQVEIYINTLAEIEYLKTLSAEEGGIVAGDEFYFASDLRPSSTRYVAEFGGHGEIAQAIQQAIADAGMQPVFLGFLPTPALTSYAIRRRKGSVMVTGSHIPFDRNGYKTNTSLGELLKKHEQPIVEFVARVRTRIYSADFAQSAFDADGRFKSGSRKLMTASGDAREEYCKRYLDFLGTSTLQGMRILCYQHSAVGRDILVDILTRLGAEVIPAGRSESFVPIDTENIEDALLAELDAMVRAAAAQYGAIDALVSTDGDSDRPLVLAARKDGSAQFLGGDCLGMVVAQFLSADAVVVPISCNDAIDRGPLATLLQPKTRIGSPYVIAGMEAAIRCGKQQVCGWEANGGFLTASEFKRAGYALAPLPTRDAMLPILCVLLTALEKQLPLCAVFDALPARYGRSALLKNFQRTKALRIVAACSPVDPRVVSVRFVAGVARVLNEAGQELATDAAQQSELLALRRKLSGYFPAEYGFAEIAALNYTDGVRTGFENEDVVHIRPSGNADELRIYAVAGSAQRAATIAAYGIQEPDGLLRQMEAMAD